MAPSGVIAVLAGWVTTEVGRQPYTVYGLLKTVDSASPLDAPAVAASLAAFVVVYFLVFGAGVVYILRLMKKPPAKRERGPERGVPTRSAGITPIAALQSGIAGGSGASTKDPEHTNRTRQDGKGDKHD